MNRAAKEWALAESTSHSIATTIARQFPILVIFTALTLMGSPALSTPHLAESEPSREWLSHEYAEVVVADFKRKHPEIPLVLDEKDLAYFASTTRAPWRISDAIKNAIQAVKDKESSLSLRQRIVSAGMKVFPEEMQLLLRRLEGGITIPLASNNDILTGELKLKSWLLDQPEASVYPHQLMTESLRMTNGHVIAAWALAWNTMRENWPAAGTRNYSSLHRRMASLTGERELWKGAAHYAVLPESEWTVGKARQRQTVASRKEILAHRRLKMVITKRGDEFSYLYHRIGVELLALTAAQLSGSSHTGWALASSGALGEYMKFTATAGLEKENSKRVNNDLEGAKSGAHLYRLIRSGKTPLQGLPTLGPDLYLKPNDSRYGKSYQVPSGRPSHYFGSTVNEKFWAPSMSVEELKLRLYHATHYDEKVFNLVILAGTGESERLHRGLMDYLDRGADDPELNELIDMWLAGFRAIPFEADVKNDLELGDFENERFIHSLDPEFNLALVQERLNRVMKRIQVTAKSKQL